MAVNLAALPGSEQRGPARRHERKRTCSMRITTARLAAADGAGPRRCACERRRQGARPTDQEVSTDVLDTIKADKSIQAGDVQKITALVDAKVALRELPAHDGLGRRPLLALPRPSSRSACRRSSRSCWCAPIPGARCRR